MLFDDRELFELPYEDREEHTVATLKAFYQRALPIFNLSVKQAKLLGARTRPITHYFKWLIPSRLFDAIHVPPDKLPAVQLPRSRRITYRFDSI